MAQYELLVLGPLLLEMFLNITWNKAYFSFGLPLFRKRLSGDYVPGIERMAATLEETTASRWYVRLTFRPISNSECAFRENMVSALSIKFLRVPYLPIMRGLIECHVGSSQVRITGFCNWYVVWGLAFIFLPAVTRSLTFLPILLVMFAGSYIVQVARFNRVCAAIQHNIRRGDLHHARDTDRTTESS